MATDGSIPNMNYKKLAFTRDHSEYILRVTDNQSEVKALKINLELGNFQFSNKIVESLPEQVSLAYNEKNLAFSYAHAHGDQPMAINFNVTGDYNDNSASLGVFESHSINQPTTLSFQR